MPGGVRFFENGTVSLNFPIADEALRARASRTTHPQSLDYFTKLYRRVLQHDTFIVDNPYIFKTKTDVVKTIVANGGEHLIAYSCSCAHTGLWKTKQQQHCGACSQCIDRRIATLAAGQADNDPDDDYASDVFTGKRKDGYEQGMAVDYVAHGIRLSRMSPEHMGEAFNRDIARAVRYMHGERASDVASKWIDMHRRHGADVARIVEEQMKDHASDLMAGQLEPTSLLAKVYGQEHLKSSWRRLATRITELLSSGIPRVCLPGHRPANEPDLQLICDGILASMTEDLRREYPFVGWSTGTAKPDFSSVQEDLWVELKYIRKKGDIRTITEDIAADITKYGDNNANVLYVVYDPERHLPDDEQFKADIEAHPGMIVSVIR